MNSMRTVLVEGLFYTQEGDLVTERGDSLYQHIMPLVGQDIQLAVHFMPPIPPDPGKWGGGCCMWQPAECPAGHHEHPDRILNISLRGVLVQETGDRWFLDTFDGKRVGIPFVLLDGHYGRVAAATVPDVQAMQEALGSINWESVEAMGFRANNLRDLMERLRISIKD